jgi:competence protein ComEA
LPGIGPDKAKAIVDYREHHGPFSCTDELTLVSGIGSATYESLREFITVTP